MLHRHHVNILPLERRLSLVQLLPQGDLNGGRDERDHHDGLSVLEALSVNEQRLGEVVDGRLHVAHELVGGHEHLALQEQLLAAHLPQLHEQHDEVKQVGHLVLVFDALPNEVLAFHYSGPIVVAVQEVIANVAQAQRLDLAVLRRYEQRRVTSEAAVSEILALIVASGEEAVQVANCLVDDLLVVNLQLSCQLE